MALIGWPRWMPAGRELGRTAGLAALACETALRWRAGADAAARLTATIAATPAEGFAAAIHALADHDLRAAGDALCPPLRVAAGAVDGAMPPSPRRWRPFWRESHDRREDGPALAPPGRPSTARWRWRRRWRDLTRVAMTMPTAPELPAHNPLGNIPAPPGPGLGALCYRRAIPEHLDMIAGQGALIPAQPAARLACLGLEALTDAPPLWRTEVARGPAADPRTMAGFDADRPRAEDASDHIMIQCPGGLMSVTGAPAGAPGGGPRKVGVPIVDIMIAMDAAIGVPAALAGRERAGPGAIWPASAIPSCSTESSPGRRCSACRARLSTRRGGCSA